MAASISPLAIRMTIAGDKQVESAVRRSASSFEPLIAKAGQASAAMRGTAEAGQQIGIGARGVNSLNSNLEKTESRAGRARKGVREVGSELKRMGEDAVKTASKVMKVWDIYHAIKSGGPVSLFSAVVPENIQKKIAFGLIGKATAEGAMLGTTVAAAGQLQQVRAGLGVNLKGSGVTVDEMMDELKKFDADSQLDFLESAKTANQMGAQGIAAKDIVPYMRAIGDAVGAMGGGQDDFAGIARALTQIKAKGKYSAEEGQQLAERGINATDILAKKTGISKADIIAGNHDIGGDEAVKMLIEGMKEKFAGGMEEAAKTIPGQLSTLSGGFFQLKAAIGEHLLPIMGVALNVVIGLVNGFNNLPEPIHKIIAWTIALDAALSGFIGVAILGLMIWLKISFTLKVIKFGVTAVNFALGLFGTSLSQLSLGIITRFVPAVGMGTASMAVMGLTILGIVVAVGALIYVMKKYYDELQHGIDTVEDARSAEQKKQDDASVKDIRAAVSESEGLSKKDQYAVLKAATAKLSEIGEVDAANEVDAQRRALGKELRAAGVDTGNSLKKAGSEAGQALVDRINSKTGNKADRLRAKEYLPSKSSDGGAPDTAAAQNQFNQISAANAALPVSGPTAPLMIGGAEAEVRRQQSADVQSAQSVVDSLQSEIYALQDKKRTANKEQKKLIEEQLVQKQRQIAAARTELAASKKLAAQEERDAKSTDKEAKKRGDLYEKDARELDKVKSDNSYNEKIEDLQDELDKARSDSDEAKVRNITLQIEKLKAQREFDEDMINARDEEDATHRKGLEAIAKEKFAYASGRGALRKADRAARDIGEGSGGKRKLSPAEVRAIFNATRTMSSGEDGSMALGANVNYGDRFAGMKDSLWSAGDARSMRDSIAGIGDFGSLNRAQMDKERKIKVKSMTQKSNGNHVVKFTVEDLEIPAGGFDEVEI